MAKISAFIFDVDGVITDTAEYQYLSWKRLADEEGLAFTRQDNDQLRGVTRRQSMLFLLKGKVVPEATMQVWMERKNAYYQEYVAQMSSKDLMAGVERFLQEAQAAGIKLGIGSASRNAKPVLEKLGVLHYFEAIGDATSVVHNKPEPHLFAWVAGALRTPIAEVCIFEDSEAGISAACALGCYSVGLGTAKVQAASLCYPDLSQLSVSALLAALEGL